MPQTSQPPPPAKGGNLKFVLIGLLFLGGAFALWMAFGREVAAPPPAAPPPKAAEPERVNPMAEQNLVLDEPDPLPAEAGSAAPEPPTKQGPSRPRQGDWECSGDLPGATKVINENRAQIRSCYERRLKINNILQGDIRLKLKVGANGKVTATALSGSLHDAEVFSCVRNLAQAWQFAVPTGGNCAVVQVPFQFSPKNP